MSTFHIFAREFAPGTNRYLKAECFKTISEAMAMAAICNHRSEVYTHYVISEKLLHEAYEEANTYFAELGVQIEHDDERFDMKWMDYIEKFINMGRT